MTVSPIYIYIVYIPPNNIPSNLFYIFIHTVGMLLSILCSLCIHTHIYTNMHII